MFEFRSAQRECVWIAGHKVLWTLYFFKKKTLLLLFVCCVIGTYILSLYHSLILYFCLSFSRILNCAIVFDFVFLLVSCFLLFFNLLLIHSFIYSFGFLLFYFNYFIYFLKFNVMDIDKTKCKQRLIYWFSTNKFVCDTLYCWKKIENQLSLFFVFLRIHVWLVKPE